MKMRTTAALAILSTLICVSSAFAEKGDSSKTQFMEAQKAQYEKKGWTFDESKAEKMFAAIDANSDGIISGDEKKAYWASMKKDTSSSKTSQQNATSAAVGQQPSQTSSGPATADIDPTTSADVQPHKGTSVEGYKIAFSDEFNGTAVDESKWEYRLDSKHWSTQLAKNNTVSDGMCSINLRKEKSGDKEYTGGGIISRKYFRYGYYEARIKCPTGAGWHTSFWMMDNHHENSDTSQVELDPLETDSIDLHEFSTDYHQWRSDIGHVKRYQLVKSPDAPLDEFHVYGMEWTPDAAHFFFDGKLVRTATDLTQQFSKEEKAAGKKPIKRNVSETEKNDVQIWFTSIATWLSNTEKVDDSMLPQSTQCDYIRFFESESSKAAMKGVTITRSVSASASAAKKLAKGDSTLEMFLDTQKAQQEKKGNEWNEGKFKKMFEQMDADGDGIVTGDEKKAYWKK